MKQCTYPCKIVVYNGNDCRKYADHLAYPDEYRTKFGLKYPNYAGVKWTKAGGYTVLYKTVGESLK